jgi:hypothetical protein
LAPEVAEEDVISAILRSLPGGLFGKNETEQLEELLERRNGKAMYHD